MNKRPSNVTVEELRDVMTNALSASGWPDLEVAKYIRAQENCGFLRPETPQHIRDELVLYFYLPPASGF